MSQLANCACNVMKMIRAIMNKRPLDDQIQHLQLEIGPFFSLGLLQHCYTLHKTSSTYVCVSLASLHNDTPGRVLKRDASVLLHNANKSYSEASKSKICGQI